jgi:hypothetical protein
MKSKKFLHFLQTICQKDKLKIVVALLSLHRDLPFMRYHTVDMSLELSPQKVKYKMTPI